MRLQTQVAPEIQALLYFLGRRLQGIKIHDLEADDRGSGKL